MGSEPELSVIIPCFGRTQTLERLLEALAHQTIDEDAFEVILVDDGNDPPLSSSLHPNGLRGIKVIRQENAGPAAARNTALQYASGRLALFLNSDAVPTNCLIEQHLRRHARPSAPIAVLGRFDSTSNVSTFQAICERAGCVFPYHLVEPGVELPPWCFWTCNLSVPLDVVRRAGGFDPSFRRPAWDDVEMGYRVAQLGVPTYFAPEIECAHDHPFDMRAFKARQVMLGSEWVRLIRKYPVAAMAGTFGLPRLPDESLGIEMRQWVVRHGGKEPSTCDALMHLLQRHETQPGDESLRALIAMVRGIAVFHWIKGAAQALEVKGQGGA